MSTASRADKIATVYKVLKKHYQPTPPPPPRSVLEHLLYACCLENNPYDKADTAFQRIQDISFDWNEVRVTAVSEIAESMVGYTEPRRSATCLRRVLQSVFEAHYSFDLEHVRKQNLGKTIKQLEKYSGATPFIISYVTQHALAGHSIPIDRGALDVMYVADVITEKERTGKSVPGLERAISKKQGIEFASLLHQLAAELVASPFSPQVRNTLLEINPDGKDRLPKRKSRKKESDSTPEPVVEPKEDAKAAAKKVVAAKSSKPVDKKTPEKVDTKKPEPKKVEVKKVVAKKPSKSKPVTKSRSKKTASGPSIPIKKKTAKQSKPMKKPTSSKKPPGKATLKTSTSKQLTKKKPR